MLLQFIEDCSICLCTALFRSHHSILIRLTLIGPLQHLDPFFALQIFCSDWNHSSVSWPSFSKLSLSDRWPQIWLWNTLVYRGVNGQLNNCKVPRSCGCRTSPFHQPSTTILESFYVVFCIIIISALFSSVQRTLFQKSCGLFWYNFANLSRAAMFILERVVFLPEILPNKPSLFSLFLIAVSWTLTFNMLTEACRVWDVALGALRGLTFGWTSLDVHYWKDCQLSWMFSTCE